MVNKGYQSEDSNIIDYQLWQLPDLALSMRGPAPDVVAGNYFTVIGAAQTFGRFVELPYGAELAQQLGLPCLNLGFSGAGPTFFTDRPMLMDLINNSRFAVIQVMSGRSVSNSCFAVQENQGVVVSTWKPSDSRPKFAEPAYREYLASNTAEDAARLRTEVRLVYIEKMQQLINAIRVPKVLLYWSTREPNYGDGFGNVHDYWGAFPHFVNQAVIEELKPEADEYVQVVTNDGLPQPLRHKETGTPSEIWPAESFPDLLRRDANFYYPSPEMHRCAVGALYPIVVNMASEGWLASTRPSPRASFADGKRHVLVHFHIFKNAGMSVDRLLYESFGTGFQAYDPEDTETCIGERDVLEYLRSKSDVVAIAGHQLRFPLSGDTSIQLHPFLFLRDPIDRAHSIYYYERMDVRRETSNLPLTRKANELDFRQFVQWCLDRPGNGAPITNYQTRVCSILHNGSCAPDWYVWTNEINLRQALGFLSMLPFVGIVERFSESIDALVADYKYLFPMLRDVKFRENTTREHSSFPLERRHEIIRNELGGDLFRLLVGHNALDMELYRYGWQRLGGIR